MQFIHSLPFFVTSAGGGREGLSDGESADLAVFRFTLGIPGFKDRYIPRLVGEMGSLLLLLNHVLLAPQLVPDAQVWALCVCMCGCICVCVSMCLLERAKNAFHLHLDQCPPAPGTPAAAASPPPLLSPFPPALAVWKSGA